LNELRKKIHKLRNEVSIQEKKNISQKLVSTFVHELNGFGVFNKIHIASYRSINNEIMVESLEDALSDFNPIFYYPKVNLQKERKMEMKNASCLCQQGWENGAYGILEPLSSCESISPEKLDFIVVPGIAYTDKRERMGSGKGYYDSYIIHTKNALTVAFAYDFQVVDELQQNTWDQNVDWLITPSKQFKNINLVTKIEYIRNKK